MSELLEVIDLVKHFGPVRAVDGVSFTLRAGETLGLVGESGCGKTTTGRCILRLTEPTSGAIRFDGEDILQFRARKLRSWRRHAQIVFQDPFASLNPRMTVGQALAEPLLVHRICSRTDVRDRVSELLKRVGLQTEHASRYPHQFSGGQRQRIVLARAIALKPRLIVADEPLSALDVCVQAQIASLLLELQKALGIAYIFVSHNLNAIRWLAQRTAVMYLGKIVEIGPTAELFAHPLHPYTQALLAAAPIPDPERRRQCPPLAGDVPSSRHIPPGCRFHPRCPYAMQECRQVEPKLELHGERCRVACHLLKSGQ